MNKKRIASIGNAFIWGAAIIASAILLRGEDHANMIVVILAGAAGASIIIVSNALREN